MRQLLVAIVAAAALACSAPSPTGSYLFVWAGDRDRKASDFLGVIDANPASPKYGAIVASLATGESKTFPHHTEQEMQANDHLLANGFGAGKSWLFDLSEPTAPKILTSFGAKAGFTHPHSYVRLPNGGVLATFQYGEDQPVSAEHNHGASAVTSGKAQAPEPPKAAPLTGGLVWMTERGDVVRSATAKDPASAYLYPYHVVPLPGIDRALSSTTDMDDGNKPATSEWLQLWRLSDLKLLKTFALEAGPLGDEHKFTGELRLLPDGKSVYVHTFSCGLYLVRDIDQGRASRDVRKVFFAGDSCGVPVVTGHFWLQPVPNEHALVSLDIGMWNTP